MNALVNSSSLLLLILLNLHKARYHYTLERKSSVPVTKIVISTLLFHIQFYIAAMM